MEDFNLKILTSFISAWNYHILGMVFMIGSLILFSLPRNEVSLVFSIVFLATFIFLEYMALRRKSEVFENEQES